VSLAIFLSRSFRFEFPARAKRVFLPASDTTNLPPEQATSAIKGVLSDRFHLSRLTLSLPKAGSCERRNRETSRFYTLRHTYMTRLTQNNEDVKCREGLLRRANSRNTLDVYAQAGISEKRLAQSESIQQRPALENVSF
jgi:hypothetical protein